MKEWLGRVLPIYHRETMVSNRTSQVTLTVLVFNFLLSLIGIFQLWLMVRESSVFGTVNYPTLLTIYLMIAMLEVVLLLLIVPALTAGSVSGERERQTLDLLLCTRLCPCDVIFGKLAAALSMVLLLIVTSLPCLSLVYIYGGVGLPDMLMLLVGMGFTAFYTGSISIFYSAQMKKTTASTVLSYLTILFLIVGTEMIRWVILQIGNALLPAATLEGGSWMDWWNWILLWNPVTTFASLFHNQVGSLSKYFYLGLEIDWILPDCLYDAWWLPASLAVQLCTSLVFLRFAGRSLSPCRHRKKQRTRKAD